MIRDREVGGSNPLAPTHLCERNAFRSAFTRPGRFTTTGSRGRARLPSGCLAVATAFSTSHVPPGCRRGPPAIGGPVLILGALPIPAGGGAAPPLGGSPSALSGPCRGTGSSPSP